MDEGRSSPTVDNTSQAGSMNAERYLGLGGMVKAFIGQTKFSGKYEEDLDYILETFDTYAEMFDLSPSQRKKSMPFKLSGNSLSFSTEGLRHSLRMMRPLGFHGHVSTQERIIPGC